MDDNNNRNLFLATALSFVVILVWFILFPPPEAPAPAEPAAVETTMQAPATTASPEATAAADSASAVAAAPRVKVDSAALTGSISLMGARFDDLSLKGYKVTQDPGSDIVRVLTPAGEAGAYYALHGWIPAGLPADAVPGAMTEWQLVKGDTLSPGKPVTLEWQNGQELTFSREIAVDEKYLFTVTDTVTNTGTTAASLAPYAQVARHGTPADLQNFFVLHEGVVGRTDGKLVEIDYDDVAGLPALEGAQGEKTDAATDGWIGFTDKYWMATLVPPQGQPFSAVTKYIPGADIYQTETRQAVLTVAPGASAAVTQQLFAGAKEWETIRGYQTAGIPGFLDSLDWGWFFFLTKPIFAVLHWLNKLIGNMGLAIIGLTFVLKLIVLPLAYKSYVSMARMKELQPEMEALKERAGDDKAKLQKEIMQLYKEKKVNPAAGCLPILIQIPIFFSLYKVIFVTLELRHAPFFGWLQDLSAPDPSSIFNLFGALPWAAPTPGTLMATIFIGVLPILLGISMWLQQKLNPAPADAAQAAIFAWMPWVFMFMLGSFASGLVVYWITNNVITFVQQYTIMRSHGHKPDIFGNIRAGFKRKAAAPPVKGKK